jgi:polysaccharide biosynthesis/export protein
MLAVARTSLLGLLSFGGILFPALAQEYRLQPGDSLQLNVAGIAELNTTAQIDIDGYWPLPLVGTIRLSDLSISEAQTQAQAALSQEVLVRRREDGSEISLMATENEIALSVAEYRPVYVDGDVQNPGEQPFRPGLTVRQVLANAGGYDVVCARSINPFVAHAELQAEYETLWLELAQIRVAEARIEAELTGQDEIVMPGFDTPVAPDVLQQFRDREAGVMASRAERDDRDRRALERSAERLRERLSFLEVQINNEQAAADADAEYEEVVRSLHDQRLTQNIRLIEAQRARLAATARVQEVAASISQTGRDIEVTERERTRLEDERRLELRMEAQAALERSSALAARLRAVEDQLAYVGALRLGALRGERGGEPTILIVRAHETPVAGSDLDTRLMPGDVVEILIPTDYLGGAF